MADMPIADLQSRLALKTLPRKDVSDTLVDIDHIAETELVRKLDRHIVPIVMLLYLFSFLDRQKILFIM